MSMLVKKALTAILACLVAFGPVGASEEWNDTVVGFVATRPDGVFTAYSQLACPPHIKATIPKEHRDFFRLAKWTDPLGTAVGCWAPYQEYVLFVWGNDLYGHMYQHEFRKLRVA
jgi:hypothetical protein